MIDETTKGYIIRNGGGTFSPIDGQPIEARDGYWVGAAKGTALKLTADQFADLNESRLRSILAEVAGGAGARFAGAWVDEDGSVHFDPTAWVETLDEALKLATENEQIAIWDIALDGPISVDDKVVL